MDAKIAIDYLFSRSITVRRADEIAALIEQQNRDIITLRRLAKAVIKVWRADPEEINIADMEQAVKALEVEIKNN